MRAARARDVWRRIAILRSADTLWHAESAEVTAVCTSSRRADLCPIKCGYGQRR